MEHLHFDVHANAGQSIRVDLNQQANVLLLDEINYLHYCQGDAFRYFGGLQKRTPGFIRVPHTGHWHVAIDLAGGSGYIQANVRVV